MDAYRSLTLVHARLIMTTPSGQMSASSSARQSPPASRWFGDCWGCRILSGSGLLISAGYVYHAARRVMRQGGTTTFGTVAQIAFAAGLAAWGIEVIADPVGKTQTEDSAKPKNNRLN